MITGAAPATINRLPVLLLPGDIFARATWRPSAAVGVAATQDISRKRLFQAGSRYWDRI